MLSDILILLSCKTPLKVTTLASIFELDLVTPDSIFAFSKVYVIKYSSTPDLLKYLSSSISSLSESFKYSSSYSFTTTNFFSLFAFNINLFSSWLYSQLFSSNFNVPAVSPFVPAVELATNVIFDGIAYSNFGISIAISDSFTGNVFLSVLLSTLTKVCNITPLPKSMNFVTSV